MYLCFKINAIPILGETEIKWLLKLKKHILLLVFNNIKIYKYLKYLGMGVM